MVKKMKNYKGNGLVFLFLITGVLLISTGALMLFFDIVNVGRSLLTQQQGTIGGTIVIFAGLLILIVGYFSLSPFSKIREFFEGKSRTKR